MTDKPLPKSAESKTHSGPVIIPPRSETPIPPHPHNPTPPILLSFLMIYFVVYGGAFSTSLTAAGKIQGQVFTTLLWTALIAALIRAKQFGGASQSVKNPFFIFMGLLAISLLVSARLSSFPRFSYEVAFQSIWYLGLALLTHLYCRTEEHRERIITALLAGGAVVLTFALLQFAGWLFDPHRDTTPAGQRVMIATMNSHNDLAGYLVLLFPLALARFLPTDRGEDSTPATFSDKVLRPFHALLALLFLFALLFTYSRCGWVGAVAEVFAFGAISLLTGQFKSVLDLLRSQKLVVIGALTLVLIALFLSPHQWFLERLRTMLTASDYGSTSRLTMWRHLAQMWQDRPVWGWGPGLLPVIYPRYLHVGEIRELIFHAHNIVLQYAVDGGMTALVLFLATLVVGFTGALRSISLMEDIGARRRQTALITAMIGFLVYSLFNCTQAIPSIMGTFWILLGVLVSQREPAGRSGKPTWIQLGFTVGLIGCGFVYYIVRVTPWTVSQVLFDQALMFNGMSRNRITLLDDAARGDRLFASYAWYRDVAVLRLQPFAVSRPFDCFNGIPSGLEDPITLSNRGWTLLDFSSASAGVMNEVFESCIRLDPALPQYRLSKAVALLRNNQPVNAERELTTILAKLSAKPPVAWLFLAQIHETRGEWEQARQDLETGISQAKLHLKIPGYQIPIRYRRLGLETESVDALPDLYSEDLLNWELAKVMEKLGRRREAGKHRAESLRLNPRLKVEPPRGYVWECVRVGVRGKKRPHSHTPPHNQTKVKQ